MKYGKIRIENGNLIFTKHVMTNYLPCRDILWAYMRREGVDGGGQKQISASYLVIVTKRRKKYKFDMTDKEIHECIQLLKALNPDITTGFPKGGKIPLQSLPNTRDLGALMTEDGRHILPKKLLRSSNLYHVSIADQDILKEEYHLNTVIDLRTRIECLEKPNTVIDGVKYHHISVLDGETADVTPKMSLLDVIVNFSPSSEDFMEKHYANMIRDKYSVKQFARFLDLLIENEKGSVLWHGSNGKDRTGVATALLLCALGVPREDVREDFMKTNLYMEEELLHMIRLLESKTIVDPKVMDNARILFKVKASYLDAVFDTIESEYGTVERFLRKALYLTPKANEQLKNKYLI